VRCVQSCVCVCARARGVCARVRVSVSVSVSVRALRDPARACLARQHSLPSRHPLSSASLSLSLSVSLSLFLSLSPSPTPTPSRGSITCEGDGFLYKMVRIIAGTLLKIGIGEQQQQSAHAPTESAHTCGSNIIFLDTCGRNLIFPLIFLRQKHYISAQDRHCMSRLVTYSGDCLGEIY